MRKYVAMGLFCLLLIFFVFPALYARDAYTVVTLSDLRDAQAPQIFGDQVLFTYSQQPPPYVVAIAFGHQYYTELHYLKKNENNVFLFLLPIDSIDVELDELQYLYIVDGVWGYDMRNPDIGYDFAGTRYSIFKLPRSGRPIVSPLQQNGSTMFFFDPANPNTTRLADITGTTYYPDTTQALVVSVVGSFNGWDSSIYHMEQVQDSDPPYYQLSLPLFPGSYRYYFVVNGVPVLDPLNDSIATEPSGKRTSFMIVPQIP